MEKIDLVMTYVDNTDTNWIKTFKKYRSNDFDMYYRINKDGLKYLLRSIAKNLPFINNIFIIVQNESEIPDYVDKSKIKIITHNKFIPSKFLPTFNSNTIESFFGNIKELSERFLYMNDDWFIMKLLSKERFFEGSKAITFFYPEKIDGEPTPFQEYLIRNNNLIWGISREDALNSGNTISMNHTIRPYFKSLYNECFTKFWNEIEPTITRFRDVKNYNLYIVDNYQEKIGRSENKKTITYRCVNGAMNDDEIRETINNFKADTLVLQDNDNNNIWDNNDVIEFLKKNFPEKCRFEVI